jgi:hypothetical protein
MAPGIFRKIFDKVKGFFTGGDDSQASNIVDKIKEKVTQVSDGARRVIDKVSDTIDYAEPVVRKGIRKTAEALDYVEPVVDRAQRIARKIRKPPPRVVEIEEYESDEAPPPPKRSTTKIIPRTFKPYKMPQITNDEVDSEDNEREAEPAAIRKQTTKFDNPATQRTKLRPILKPKKVPKPEFYSD